MLMTRVRGSCAIAAVGSTVLAVACGLPDDGEGPAIDGGAGVNVDVATIDSGSSDTGATDSGANESGSVAVPDSGHDATDSASTDGMGMDSPLHTGTPDSALADGASESGAMLPDSSQPDSNHPDSNHPDSNQPDSSQPDSSQPDSGGGVFPATCPTGTIYVEPFTSNPVTSGTFLPLVGPWTYNSGSQTISLQTGAPNTQLWIGPRPSWTNYTISVPIRLDTGGGNAGINFRMVSTPETPTNDSGQMYFAGIATNQVLLGIQNGGNWTEFSGPMATFSVGSFHMLQVTAQGNQLSVSVDGTTYASQVMDGTFSFGSLGLRTYKCGMTFGTITVTCD
jgi:hypothetical protein